MRIKISQVKFIATKISMSQQIAQPAIRTREEKSVVTEISKKSKESCRDIENFVATKFFYVTTK